MQIMQAYEFVFSFYFGIKWTFQQKTLFCEALYLLYVLQINNNSLKKFSAL